MERDTNRYEILNRENEYQNQRILTKKENYKCGTKNQGGAAFNIVTLSYENSKDGQTLARIDNDAMVRALMRSRVLD